jgi:hypothetical protein
MAILNLGSLEQVSKFKTADGKEFTSREEARQHQVEQAALQALRDLLKASISSSQVRSGNVDNVLRQMLMEGQEIRNILLAYSKMQPKKKEETVAAAA